MHEPASQSAVSALRCMRCSRTYPVGYPIDSKGCPACRAVAPTNFEVVYSDRVPAARELKKSPESVGLSAYATFLPVASGELVSLGEGNTPLLQASALGAELDLPRLFIKDESRNPTWSHKDRFSAVAVSHAQKLGHRFVATASSGNAGASLAAYAAKAGMSCLVATFDGAAGPMVEQVRRYGAMVVTLRDKAQRWTVLAEGAEKFGWFVTSPFAAPVIGSHPIGIEGYKTIAYEVFQQLGGRAPDWMVVPTAYGDVLYGIWRGFQDLCDVGNCEATPRMVAAEIYGSLRKTMEGQGDAIVRIKPKFDTQALSIGTVQGTYQALKSLRQSSGCAESIEDASIWAMQEKLARTEGLFGELSGVTSLVAAAQLRARAVIAPSEEVVCLMTASGLKDLDQVPLNSAKAPPIEGTLEDVLADIGARYGFTPSAQAPAG